ncbi:MAG TPA: diguanylate cyclase [Bacillales bacterium]|nr:diguanylate cyclase [Bacillales bacterium]
MNSIFSPAVSLMKKLKYPHKFALIGVIFLLPITVMLFLLISDMKDKIDFIEKEKLGIEYTLHSKNLIADMQQHRGMTNAYLSGDQSFKEELALKKSQIELKIEQLDAVDKKLGAELKTEQKWNEIKDMWNTFQRNANQLSVNETLDEHTEIIAKMLEFMNHIGNTSNLYLDTGLRNYHLAESYMNIPIMTEKIGQTRAYGSGYIAKKTMTVDERTKLFVLSILIGSTLEDIKNSVNTVLSENVPNKTLIKANLEKTISETEIFLDVLNKNVLDTEEITISPNHYFLLASRAIDSAFILYEIEAQTLTDVLESDIHHIEKERTQIVLLLITILLILSYLFIAFYKSVRDTVFTFEQTATKIASGDLNARLSLETNDELKHAGDSFNIMAEALCNKIDELKIAEEQLQEQKEFSDNLIQNSTTATFVINAAGNITIWNKACEELTGLKAQTILGTSDHWKAFFEEPHPCLADLIIRKDQINHYSIPYDKSRIIPDGLHAEGWFILNNSLNHYLYFDAAPLYNHKGELTAVIETLMDMTDKKRNEDKIKYKAYHDPLTELPNRNYLQKAIGKALLHAKEENRMIALLFIDLDGFKIVNDTHGHDVGDKLLKIAANRLNKYAGEFDTVARLGGDEFVILFQEVNKPSDTGIIAQNIINEINKPIVIGNSELFVGATIGISLFPNNGKDNETLMRHADLAMYHAKKKGKNRYQFYSSFMCDFDCKLKSCLIKNLNKNSGA